MQYNTMSRVIKYIKIQQS